jgi:hypothetical protein
MLPHFAICPVQFAADLSGTARLSDALSRALPRPQQLYQATCIKPRATGQRTSVVTVTSAQGGERRA